MTHRLVVTAAAAAAAGGTALALHLAGGAAAGSATYLLRAGDFARVPAIGWTCAVARSPQGGSRPALLCTTDGKPIRSLWISGTRIFVGAGHAPARAAKGYVFPY